MDLWTVLEYAAWGLSALFALYIVIDWIHIDSTHDEAFLTSSREGEIEAINEARLEGER
jgi:hypothetical protein